MNPFELLPWALLLVSWGGFLGFGFRKKPPPGGPVPLKSERPERVKCIRWNDCSSYADPLCGSGQCSRCCWWYCNEKCGKGEKKRPKASSCNHCGAHDAFNKCRYCGKTHEERPAAHQPDP